MIPKLPTKVEIVEGLDVVSSGASRSYNAVEGRMERGNLPKDETGGTPAKVSLADRNVEKANGGGTAGRRLYFYEDLLIMHDAERNMRMYCRHDVVDLYINDYVNTFWEARNLAKTPSEKRLLYTTVRSFFSKKGGENIPPEYEATIEHIEKILSKKDRVLGTTFGHEKS
jgi:hypothetical protein